MKEDNAKLNRN